MLNTIKIKKKNVRETLTEKEFVEKYFQSLKKEDEDIKINKKQIPLLISIFLKTMRESVEDGKKVTFKNNFSVWKRIQLAREVKLFKTGERKITPESESVKFSLSDNWKKIIKENYRKQKGN